MAFEDDINDMHDDPIEVEVCGPTLCGSLVDKEECAYTIMQPNESIPEIDYVECVQAYDIRNEQETSLLFDVLPFFVSLDDDEAIDADFFALVCLHEVNMDVLALNE